MRSPLKRAERTGRNILFIRKLTLFLVTACFSLGLSCGLAQSSDRLLMSLHRHYDVIVTGGDAEGIAAAIAAARAGASTLLIDTRPKLGGLLTRGWLNTIDLNLDRLNRPLNGGIFGEVYRELDDHSFDVATMEAILARLVGREKNLDVVKGALTILPVIGSASMPLFRPGQTLNPDDRDLPEHLITSVQPPLRSAIAPVIVDGVEIHADSGKSLVIYGNRIIDATQDADLAIAAGAGWKAYGEDVWGVPRNMATTLVFRLDNIADADWQKMCAALSGQKVSGGLLGGTRRSIWGFSDVMKKYTASTDRIRMRGLNLGRQNDGSVLVNALLVFGIDGLSCESRHAARQLATAELPRLLVFLQKNIAGMSTAGIADVAPELYVRTSRQILAQYTLTVDDVLENRDFVDRACFGSYPLDIQAQVPDHHGDVTGKPEQYAVPLRSLIPVGFSNLMVVGRSAGFDALAQSSARTIPVGMAAGQAAGVAAVLSIRKGRQFDLIASDPLFISELHEMLTGQGVDIAPNSARAPVLVDHWAYQGLKYMRRRGQISGGYKNEYWLDRPIGGKAFANRLLNTCSELNRQDRQWLYNFSAAADSLNLGMACKILTCVEGFAGGDAPTNQKNLEKAPDLIFSDFQKRGMFNAPWPEQSARWNMLLTRGGAYMLLMRWSDSMNSAGKSLN